ncbi:hypothetical protein MMC22_004284 [Lobaria immixta]|nr:hypothetical protein [Lobaria immixta]
MPAAKNSKANTSGVTSRRGKRKAKKAAKKDETNISHPAQQPTMGVVVSSDGKTQTVDGELEYYSDNGWISAVYHDDIRGRLLAEGPQGIYDIPRLQGKGKDDVTSFHPDYKTTGPDRENRHKILFRYKQNGYAAPSYTPDIWVYRGQIVLDPESDPVLKWREIPLVLSSAYEGYDMEVIRRLNPNIKVKDFRARMPRTILKGSSQKKSWGPSTLSMRISRFRLSACCLAWSDREGSDVIKAYLDKLLPQQCHDDNSTENFRDLTKIETKEARRLNKGKFLNRAGKKALDDATRQERDEVEEQRSEKLVARHNEIVGAAPLLAVELPAPQRQDRKRKRAQSSLDLEGEEENTRPAKRQECATNIDPALLHAGSSGDTGNSTWRRPNGIDGPGRTDSLRQQSEAPEILAQTPNSEPQELGFGQEFDASTSANEDDSGPVEETPLYMDPPAVTGPYFLSHAQRQALAEAQLSDQRVDFRFIHPINETDENSIQLALYHTREDCRQRLGLNTLDIPSTSWETYSHQYLEIQGFFEQLWAQVAGGEEAPVLFFLEAWGGGFDGWVAPAVEW